MIKNYTTFEEFLIKLNYRLANLPQVFQDRLEKGKDKAALRKIKHLNTDKLMYLIIEKYGSTGRPALYQPEIFRSFILMCHYGFTSIDNWCNELKNNELYQYLVGIDRPLAASNHRDFINRLTEKKSIKEIKTHSEYAKPKKSEKPKNKEKWRSDQVFKVSDEINKYTSTPIDYGDYQTLLQTILFELGVKLSIENGNIDTKNLILSADGSALHTHASHYGIKTCDCDKFSKCECDRLFKTDADWGYDTDKEQFYFGYTFYNVSHYNPVTKKDLPIYFSIEAASKHDSLSFIRAVSTTNFLFDNTKIKYFCHDSAADNIDTFEYLHSLGIIPIIDINKRRSNNPFKKFDFLNDQGKVVCQAGFEMTRNGYDSKRKRTKFRCPLATGKIKDCPNKENCSKSPYGKVFYVNDKEAIKLLGPVPYKSDAWKEIYKNRTSTERMNNTILNRYKLSSRVYKAKKLAAFASLIACINIHLNSAN